MKKILFFILAALLVFSMTACGNDQKDDKGSSILADTKTNAGDIDEELSCSECGSTNVYPYGCPGCGVDDAVSCSDCGYCTGCSEICPNCDYSYTSDESTYCPNCESCDMCGSYAENGQACDDCGIVCLSCGELLAPQEGDGLLMYCEFCDSTMCIEHDVIVDGYGIYCEEGSHALGNVEIN